MPDICGLKISPFADHGKEFVFIIFNEIEREISFGKIGDEVRKHCSRT